MIKIRRGSVVQPRSHLTRVTGLYKGVNSDTFGF